MDTPDRKEVFTRWTRLSFKVEALSAVIQNDPNEPSFEQKEEHLASFLTEYDEALTELRKLKMETVAILQKAIDDDIPF